MYYQSTVDIIEVTYQMDAIFLVSPMEQRKEQLLYPGNHNFHLYVVNILKLEVEYHVFTEFLWYVKNMDLKMCISSLRNVT